MAAISTYKSLKQMSFINLNVNYISNLLEKPIRYHSIGTSITLL